MKTVKVKELMVPLKEYARLDENKTLYDAVMALRAQQKQKANVHTSLLVITKGGRIATMLTMLDIFRFMEPKYKDVEDLDLTRFGMQPDYVESMLQSFDLWASPLEDICKKTTGITLKEMKIEMIPQDIIDEEATLDRAVHRMIVDTKHALLVTRDEEFTGVLRSVDIFTRFCEAIETCVIPREKEA